MAEVVAVPVSNEEEKKQKSRASSTLYYYRNREAILERQKLAKQKKRLEQKKEMGVGSLEERRKAKMEKLGLAMSSSGWEKMSLI